MKIYKVQLRKQGKITYYASELECLQKGQLVIVDHDRGIDYAKILDLDSEGDTSLPQVGCLPLILRIADTSDLERIVQSEKQATLDLATAKIKLKQYALQMKMIHAEYSFDHSKFIIYFVADGRVDFRSLVKELARIFRVRIELRQVGARDETRLMGGLGSCGRKLCCSSFIKEFKPVSIKMARDQNMSTQPSKISGACGKLMCCLSYENDVYQEIRKNLPNSGEVVVYNEQEVRVLNVNVLKKQILISYTHEGFQKNDWVSIEQLNQVGCPQGV